LRLFQLLKGGCGGLGSIGGAGGRLLGDPKPLGHGGGVLLDGLGPAAAPGPLAQPPSPPAP
jgi:hypothetical protein